MPQQINLCVSVAAPQRQRFPASTMFLYLAASLLMLVGIGGFWLWSLEQSARTYRLTLETQSSEIKNLQAAIQIGRATATSVDPGLIRELEDQRAQLQQRERMLKLVREGMYQPGAGHSDRLLILSRSIPPDTWVSGVKVDSAAFAVSGFTLEPSSLNDWVGRLSQSPLMRGLSLDTVAVNLVAEAKGAGAVKAPTTGPATWAFSLLSLAPAQVAPVPATSASAPAANGGKP
jgi:Tfp pilus assembly protein PilN